MLNGLTSLGSESSSAAQLAAWLGLARRPWHIDYIKGQVKAAVMMEDLEGRADGWLASSSVQGIQDVRHTESKMRKKVLEPEPIEVIVPPKPKRGLLGKSVRLRSGRIIAEEAVEGGEVDQ